MRFPLADWIDEHADCRHDLGRSGMWGEVRHPRPSPQDVKDASSDDLVDALARLLHVSPSRLFLTHGASEANSWVILHLARRASGSDRRCRVRFPEYPPLWEMARWAGLRIGEFAGPVRLALVSQPRNPDGLLWGAEEFDAWSQGARAVLVDETFREFTSARSRAASGDPRVWTTGTFTKAYAGDDIRVGWVVAPPGEASGFATLHGVAGDEIAPYSVAMALRTLRSRDRVIGESRRIFERNRGALAAALDGGGRIRGPVYFDRVPGRGDAVARACLRASVLVCPGRFFGEPSGVRLTLTRRTFPEDLDAYLAVRGAGTRGRGSVSGR